jgi:hypothetical protein
VRLHNSLPTALLIICLIAAPLLAHHSVAATFDASKAMTIQGTITKVEWNNPHVWIDINVKAPDGTIIAWHVQLAATGALARAGFEKSFIDFSKSFSMQVWPAFDGSKHASGRTLTLSDGRTFDVSDKWPESPAAHPPAK